MHNVRDNYKFNLLNNAILVGEFNVPELEACNIIPKILIPFDKALKEKNTQDKFIHFYINDFQFDRVWNLPNNYIKLFKRYAGVIAPDFSMFVNVPKAFNIYQHYKKQCLAHYWQSLGINVIPSFGCVGVKSYSWCFDGLPNNSTIAISTVGVEKEIFLESIKELNKRLNPTTILVYGNNYPELEINYGKKIIRYESRTEHLHKIKKRSKMSNGNK